MELWNVDPNGPNGIERLASGYTDDEGRFNISGSTSLSEGNLQYKVYHLCNDSGPCRRKVSIPLPRVEELHFQLNETRFYDTYELGSLELAEKMDGEEIEGDCNDNAEPFLARSKKQVPLDVFINKLVNSNNPNSSENYQGGVEGKVDKNEEGTNNSDEVPVIVINNNLESPQDTVVNMEKESDGMDGFRKTKKTSGTKKVIQKVVKHVVKKIASRPASPAKPSTVKSSSKSSTSTNIRGRR